MARWWSEPLDVEKHRDFMGTTHIGGLPIEPVKDRLIEQRVYFVEVAGLTFHFAALQQIELDWPISMRKSIRVLGNPMLY